MRTLIVAIALAALAAPAFAGAPVELKPALQSRGDSVTLADLFDGATGPAGTVVVANASAPGYNTVLDAARVQVLARHAGLDWANATGIRRILVASTAAPAAPATSGGAATGARAPRAVQVLAYARSLMAGEIVQASDLVWSDAVLAPAGAPSDPDRIIGQAARRPLRAGAAVLASDLAAPLVIRRDDTINVAYEAAGMRLVLQGKALKDAAMGESVPVLNPQSKKVIDAVAAGPGKAVVGPRAEAVKAAAFTTASLR